MKQGHVRVLDGIRGLAILVVMICHTTDYAGPGALDRWICYLAWGGWVGVDMFFVLSGYLITGILLDTKGSPSFFRTFYARRVLRIFPLYYAVVALCFFVLPALLPPDKAARFGKIDGSHAYYWLYLQNFPIGRLGWRHAVLDITWSLAIEEQFYLVWPTVVFLCAPRTIKRVCGALFVTSLGARLFATYGLHLSAFANYVMTPCRMEALAAGAFLAVRAREPGGLAVLVPRARTVTLAAGAVAVALIFGEQLAGIAPPSQQPGLGPYSSQLVYTALALFFGGLLVLIVEAPASSRRHRVFASKALGFLGTYSYGLYLVHIPVRAVVRDLFYGPAYRHSPHVFFQLRGSELPGQLLFYVLVAGPILLAGWLSFHVFEKRFLDLKRFFPSGRAAAAPSTEATRAA
jgi:peptidoglycan/LPS O-acetylase OafA/YrhL